VVAVDARGYAGADACENPRRGGEEAKTEITQRVVIANDRNAPTRHGETARAGFRKWAHLTTPGIEGRVPVGSEGASFQMI
jgi:hypothetical protein